MVTSLLLVASVLVTDTAFTKELGTARPLIVDRDDRPLDVEAPQGWIPLLNNLGSVAKVGAVEKPPPPPEVTVPTTMNRDIRVNQQEPRAEAMPAPSGDAVSMASEYGCSPSSVILEDKGHWGAADLDAGVMYIRPSLTGWQLRYTVAHECAHIKQGQIYGGHYAAEAGLASAGGIEINADCVTVLLGLGGQYYTTSCGGVAGEAARATLNGLPFGG